MTLCKMKSMNECKLKPVSIMVMQINSHFTVTIRTLVVVKSIVPFRLKYDFLRVIGGS